MPAGLTSTLLAFFAGASPAYSAFGSAKTAARDAATRRRLGENIRHLSIELMTGFSSANALAGRFTQCYSALTLRAYRRYFSNATPDRYSSSSSRCLSTFALCADLGAARQS